MILVTYASKFGTTQEVAEVIGQILCRAGTAAETKCVDDVYDLSSYDAVIIGSAIQYDTWMPQARKFVATHQYILSRLPVAYFFTCLTLSVHTEKAERQAEVYEGKLYTLQPQVRPVSVGRFAGALDYNRMSFTARLAARVIYAVFGVREGDYRDWHAIQHWTEQVHAQFNTSSHK